MVNTTSWTVLFFLTTTKFTALLSVKRAINTVNFLKSNAVILLRCGATTQRSPGTRAPSQTLP